jgi:hypothetical protein
MMPRVLQINVKSCSCTTSRENRQSKSRQIPVRNKNGSLLTTSESQLQRWHGHFNKTLDFVQATSLPTITEIRKAINDLKPGKAAGIDQIPPEVLKADVHLFANILYIFKQTWELEKFLDDWLQGVLIKLPKKVI